MTSDIFGLKMSLKTRLCLNFLTCRYTKFWKKLDLTPHPLSGYYKSMTHTAYELLQARAYEIARTLPKPAFYHAHAPAVHQADETLRTYDLIRKCHAYLDESKLECAHGLCHCEAVARDAGAIVLVEGARRAMGGNEIMPLFIAAIIAGLLHDIKRREDDHAVLGSLEAEAILKTLKVDERSRTYITYAIRNHEAFKTTCDLDDAEGCMVSDALYDADKFRWGPENFTGTLWLMVNAHETPIASLHKTFREKMKGIERIKDTFRTDTGKQYGPEFIDQGIQIGNAIYMEMSAMLQPRS